MRPSTAATSEACPALALGGATGPPASSKWYRLLYVSNNTNDFQRKRFRANIFAVLLPVDMRYPHCYNGGTTRVPLDLCEIVTCTSRFLSVQDCFLKDLGLIFVFRFAL